ncbi:hypothetical protein MMC07_007581 [Pseudocyphellaria aurata]|nr:hypothetical protein [Pseudocyphellaria aurata]
MGSKLRVPTVTQDDLKGFQARSFPSHASQHEDHNRGGEDFDEDDDNLGYYPDGVKRTLTDEQVAMFRHSEIYALYRERQIRQESLDAGFELQPDDSEWGANAPTGTKALSASELQTNVVPEAESEDEEGYARFLEAEKREADAIQRRKKRKMSHANGFDHHGRPATHRRIARELDIVAADEQVLDYDEEPSKSTKICTDTAERETLHDDDKPKQQLRGSSRAALQAHDLPVEGRKIWWPTIGK